MHRHPRRRIPFGADNFLSILEGIEGGFAIFVGIIVGLYFQNVTHELLIKAGLIGIIVNAFNSSAVRYASEHYYDEMDGHEKRNKFRAYFVPAFIEFATYAVVSFIAVIPLLILIDSLTAIILTTILTLTILFVAGAYRGHLFRRHPISDGLELASIGIAIIFVGASAGWVIANVVS